MVTVSVNKLRLFGYHGIHEEEAIIGSEFEINLFVDFDDRNLIEILSDTVNYVELVQIVKDEFAQRKDLVETVAQQIAMRIYEKNNFIKNINISIEKLNAPIANFTGSVGVVYSKYF